MPLNTSGTTYEVSFKKKMVEEIRQRGRSLNDISYRYRIPPSTIRSWVLKYDGVESRKTIDKMENVMKDQETKVKELQAALSDAHLRLMVYEKMIEIAKEEYGVEFKKNSNTGEYEVVKEHKKSKNSAR